MERFTENELLEVLPTPVRKGKELTKKQKMVLGQLIMYNSLDQSKNNGYFYRSNKDFCNDLGIETHTLLSALHKLEDMGFIERNKGSRGLGASEYVLHTERLNEGCKNVEANYTHSYTVLIERMSDRIRVLEEKVQFLMDRITPNAEEKYTSDTDTEKELELELEYKNLNNKELIDNNINYNNKNNNINNNIFKENTNREKEHLQSKTEEVETEGRAWADSLFLDPNDFEEDDTYVEELNKKLAYDRWDSEEQEARLLEGQNLL